MTSTPSHQAGNSRRDQLTSALVVGGVLVVLGAASGLGIEVTSGASPLAKPPAVTARALPTAEPSTSAPAPVNYIGIAGPGNLPNQVPGIVRANDLPSALRNPGPQSTASPTAVTPHTTAPTSTTPAPSWPTVSCPSDVVTGLLDMLLGNKGLQSNAGLLKTVLGLLPNLGSLLKGAGLSSVLTTDVGSLSAAQTDAMARACTPVLSGLLGGN